MVGVKAGTFFESRTRNNNNNNNNTKNNNSKNNNTNNNHQKQINKEYREGEKSEKEEVCCNV